MDEDPRQQEAALGRRRFVLLAAKGMLAVPLSLSMQRALRAAPAYPKTLEALKHGFAAETRAHRRYLVFGSHAKRDGYAGIAYLYTALATSELIHAQNYARVLAQLGEPPFTPPVSDPSIASTKENLIASADAELASIEKTYPKLLQAVESEGLEEAAREIRYSWDSHKQHLDIINKIRRWSPSMFETVARRIDEHTDRYYVCEVCGSTVTEPPETSCPICGVDAGRYRRIPPDQYF